jgi:hypothetical protein
MQNPGSKAFSSFSLFRCSAFFAPFRADAISMASPARTFSVSAFQHLPSSVKPTVNPGQTWSNLKLCPRKRKQA